MAEEREEKMEEAEDSRRSGARPLLRDCRAASSGSVRGEGSLLLACTMDDGRCTMSEFGSLSLAELVMGGRPGEKGVAAVLGGAGDNPAQDAVDAALSKQSPTQDNVTVLVLKII